MSDPKKMDKALLRGPCEDCGGPGGVMMTHPVFVTSRKKRLCEWCLNKWIQTADIMGATMDEIQKVADQKLFDQVTKHQHLYRTNEEEKDADEVRDNGDVPGDEGGD